MTWLMFVFQSLVLDETVIDDIDQILDRFFTLQESLLCLRDNYFNIIMALVRNIIEDELNHLKNMLEDNSLYVSNQIALSILTYILHCRET